MDPAKYNFWLNFTLIKYAKVVSDQSVQQPEDERVEIFAKFMMTPLCANGLSDEFFSKCSENWNYFSGKLENFRKFFSLW